MFDLLKAAILGVVEGVTEFLPISSTGHLIIVNRWVGFGAELTKTFDVVIQLGAILAVAAIFWKEIWPFRPSADKTKIFSLWKKALVGCLPAIAIGGLFGSLVEQKFFNPLVVAAALIVGGVIIILVEMKNKSGKINSLSELTYPVVLAIGSAQCLAMIPGTSRSAATIIAALLLGAARPVAAEFSFFLAVPTMIAASAYSLLKGQAALNGHDLFILLTGFIVAFATALWVVKKFLNYVRQKNFIPFGWYRIALGTLVLLIILFA